MKIDFKGILEGAWNSVFVKDSIEKVSRERLNICESCEHRKKREIPPFDNKCGICGCNLEMKSRCLSCECPIQKWVAVTSQEDDIKIEEKLKEGEDGKNS